MYKKPKASIVLNGERMEVFPLNSGTRQGFPCSPLPFNMLLEVLAGAVRHETQIKGIQIWNEGLKLSLFTDDIILYIREPRINQALKK